MNAGGEGWQRDWNYISIMCSKSQHTKLWDGGRGDLFKHQYIFQGLNIRFQMDEDRYRYEKLQSAHFSVL